MTPRVSYHGPFYVERDKWMAYSAVDDETYDGPEDPHMGWGESPQAAIEDLERLLRGCYEANHPEEFEGRDDDGDQP